MYLDNKHICCSKTPFFTAARVFLRAGVSKKEPLEMWREGREHWDLRSTVGYAAKWTIHEEWNGPKRRRYVPRPHSLTNTTTGGGNIRLNKNRYRSSPRQK